MLRFAGRERGRTMSRNTDKITKALLDKGYRPVEMRWDPIGGAPIMCGPEGGWYIEVVLADDPEGYVDTILAYSTPEVLEEIERLPAVIKEGHTHADD